MKCIFLGFRLLVAQNKTFVDLDLLDIFRYSPMFYRLNDSPIKSLKETKMSVFLSTPLFSHLDVGSWTVRGRHSERLKKKNEPETIKVFFFSQEDIMLVSLRSSPWRAFPPHSIRRWWRRFACRCTSSQTALWTNRSASYQETPSPRWDRCRQSGPCSKTPNTGTN